jgi:hydrogenase nickel incorporation protein HypA/HybF
MHELSIAESLIELACDATIRERAERVSKLIVRIGVLSGVVKEALQFSFGIASEGTACEGAELEIEEVGVTIACPKCRMTKPLLDIFDWRCPDCGTATSDVITGRELDLAAIVVESQETAPADS